MRLVRHLVRPRVLLGAAAGLLAVLLGYGMYRERTEQPTAASSPNSPPSDAVTGPEPTAFSAGSPSAKLPTASDLRQAVCVEAEEDSCSCRMAVIKKAFGLALQAVAREALDGAPQDCAAELTSSGLRAEVLARSGDLADARREAESLLLQQPKNPYAMFATALVLFAQGELQPSSTVARRAVEAGRGAPAHMLLGLLALHDGKMNEAARHLDEALAQDPDDVEAHFNRAVVHERRKHYNGAREGYLKALALRPTHADSRYGLARLTHAAGAFDEARHHLNKLTEIAPEDERLPALAAQLRGEGPSARAHRAPAPRD